MTRRRILVVGMLDSIHLARWIEAIDVTQCEITLFPSGPHRRLHPRVRELARGKSIDFQTRGPLPGVSLLIWVLDTCFGLGIRRRWFRRVLISEAPALIHAMEMQHAGYMVERILQGVVQPPTFMLTLWGSDINWFKTKGRHVDRMRHVLERTDILVAECRRDLDAAAHLGFVGRQIHFLALTGGIDEEYGAASQPFPTLEHRHEICLKGYSGFMGRAPLALRATVRVLRSSQGWRLTVYAASWRVAWLSYWFRWRHCLNIAVHRKGSLTDQEIRAMFARSRIAVMISYSDGFPASLKEAILFGSIPVMAATSCAREVFGADMGPIEIGDPSLESIGDAVVRLMSSAVGLDDRAFGSREELLRRFQQSEFRRRVNTAYTDALMTP